MTPLSSRHLYKGALGSHYNGMEIMLLPGIGCLVFRVWKSKIRNKEEKVTGWQVHKVTDDWIHPACDLNLGRACVPLWPENKPDTECCRFPGHCRSTSACHLLVITTDATCYWGLHRIQSITSSFSVPGNKCFLGQTEEEREVDIPVTIWQWQNNYW